MREATNRIIWQTKDAELTLYDRTEHPVQVRGTDAEERREPTRKYDAEVRGTDADNNAEFTRKWYAENQINWARISYGIYALIFAVLGYGIYLLVSVLLTWLLTWNWTAIFRALGLGIAYAFLGCLALLAAFEFIRNRKYRRQERTTRTVQRNEGTTIINQTVIINKK